MKKSVLLLLALTANVMTPAVTFACSVCYGDPNSLQVRGAEAGVLFLLGVIGTVLLSFAGMILFWGRRAKRIAQVTNTVTFPSLS
jgi:hypothetical protein